jgi:hypothetical protein
MPTFKPIATAAPLFEHAPMGIGPAKPPRRIAEESGSALFAGEPKMRSNCDKVTR